MQPQLRYIELKTGHAHNGPAWIARVEFSKSGKTVYFNGKALKGNAHGACRDIETNEIYWISGVKKDGENRHWYGNGKIMVDREAIDELLAVLRVSKLDPKRFIIVDIPKTDKSRFAVIENMPLDETDNETNYPGLETYTVAELEIHIGALKRREIWINYNNGLKFIQVRRMAAESRLQELKNPL